MEALKKLIIEWGTLAGSVAAIFGIWAIFGIATSGDIKRLDCKYAPAAVAAFNSQRMNLLVIKPADTPESQNAHKFLLEQNQKNLDIAVEHSIKCPGR